MRELTNLKSKIANLKSVISLSDEWTIDPSRRKLHVRPSKFMKKPAELFSLKDKVAVVIGGTGELCGAMAEGMAAAGASVAIVGRDRVKAQARL